MNSAAGTSEDGLSVLFAVTAASAGERPPMDPELIEWRRRLHAYIFESRDFIATYNIILLGILAIFSLSHLIRQVRDRRRGSSAAEPEDDNDGCVERDEGSAEEEAASTSSSSSSTLEGSATPPTPGGKKQYGDDGEQIIDLERQPLLSGRHTPLPPLRPGRRLFRRMGSILRSFLMYQPGPPAILFYRALPSNGTTLCVLSFYALVLFYNVYGLPLDPSYSLAYFSRCGTIFIANLPLLYLLAAKNQPLKLLTGRSYEALNIYHRRVGELLCAEAAVHFGGMLLWRVWLSPTRDLDPSTWAQYLTHPIILFGLVTVACYELLYVTSLRAFRERCYEAFLASHVVLQVLALAFLWLHYHTSRPYVYASLGIFVADRLVWRVGVKSTAGLVADLRVLEDGQTVMVSADWDIVAPGRDKRWRWWWPGGFVRKAGILHGWHPADHVFVSIPKLGRTHMLQAHPFTIASAAPDLQRSSDQAGSSGTATTHAWLSLLMRVHSGFTSDLLAYARSHTSVPVRLDGPYGSSAPLDMLRATDTNILIAGGSGIAVLFPLVWDLAQSTRRRGNPSTSSSSSSPPSGEGSGKESRRKSSSSRRTRTREIHLLWVVHSRAQTSWIPGDRWDELRELGVSVTIPEPTEMAGRPDVGGWMEELLMLDTRQSPGRRRDSGAGSGDGGTTAITAGVVVSGPDGLNRAARNTCAGAVRRGREVRLCVEKFGW